MQASAIAKRIAIGAVFVAEIAVLAVVSYGARDLPTDGVMVGEKDVTIEVQDQSVWGAYAVSRVVTPVDGWVILRADWGDGEPAELVGAAPVSAGENLNVAVVVDPSRTHPPGVFASLVADKGDIGSFEYTTGDPDDTVALGGGMGGGGMGGGGGGPAMSGPVDKPLIADGEVVSERFRVTPFDIVFRVPDANIGAAFLNEAGDSVEVRRVDAPSDSWVTIIRGPMDEGDPSKIIGSALVPAGHSALVTIPLDEVPETSNVTALLVADLGAPGVLEIDPVDPARSPDAPYLVLSYFVQIAVLPSQ